MAEEQSEVVDAVTAAALAVCEDDAGWDTDAEGAAFHAEAATACAADCPAPEVRAAIRDELIPWALGVSEPVREWGEHGTTP